MKRDTPLLLGIAGGTALAAYALISRRGRPPGVPDSGASSSVGTSPEAPSSPPAKAKLLRAVSRRFDPIFREHAGVMPVAYLRALAKRESNMDPKEQSGPAWGLMQVVEVVRRDFNKRHGTDYPRTDLHDPETNVRMATWLLHVIIASYRRNHSGVPNMLMDWPNPRFVELLTAGWNAGWSERAGLGRVVRYLEKQGKTDITIDDVYENAKAAGAVRFLSERARWKWWKSVARLYMSEALRDYEALS